LPTMTAEYMFRDRSDAGRQLAAHLLRYADTHPVVLALPRGGVPVAFEVAKVLKAPLDLVLVRKIGAPGQPELAVGAVAEGPEEQIFINPFFAGTDLLMPRYIEDERAHQMQEIERRRAMYLNGRDRAEVAGHTAIVVDDGIATGATMRAALRAVRHRAPRRLVLAVPVGPSDTLDMMRLEADDIVCVATPESFHAVGEFYRDFHQVADEEVRDLLQRSDVLLDPSRR